jgi:hypothetical protein
MSWFLTAETDCPCLITPSSLFRELETCALCARGGPSHGKVRIFVSHVDCAMFPTILRVETYARRCAFDKLTQSISEGTGSRVEHAAKTEVRTACTDRQSTAWRCHGRATAVRHHETGRIYSHFRLLGMVTSFESLVGDLRGSGI